MVHANTPPGRPDSSAAVRCYHDAHMNTGMLRKPVTEVLIGILKNRRDLNLLMKRRLYRIPVSHTPQRPFSHLAFYQPSAFGRSGKSIRFIAPVLGRKMAMRRDMITGEPGHPRADHLYWFYRVGKPMRLPSPVRNLGPRRFTFAYTSLRRLHESHDILEVFGVPPIERIIGEKLSRAGIPVHPEFTLNAGTKRYRLDFACFCRNGQLAIECDGLEFHNHPAQARYDRVKDRRLEKLGWKVLRLDEDEIVENPGSCLKRIKKQIALLNGSTTITRT